jgi:excisionase family DNA binding protein
MTTIQAPAREWLTVAEFLKRHKDEAGKNRIGRNSIYSRIADKTIPSIRLGKRILLPSDALDQLLAKEAAGDVR